MKHTTRAAALVFAGAIAIAAAACGSETESSADVRDNIDRMRSFLGSTNVPLPAVTVELGTDGRVERLAGFDAKAVDEIAEGLTGQPLMGRIVVLEPKYLRWFDRADVQHLTVASRPEGLFLLVNGKALPYLAWDAVTAETLVDVLGKLVKEEGEGVHLLSADAHRVISALVPFMHSLNVRFDILIPDMDESGRDVIPLPSDSAFTLALTDEEVEAEPLQTVDLEIVYRELEDGRGWVPSLFGFSTVDLDTIGGPFEVDVPRLRLREDIRERIESEGIDNVGVEARADGLFMSVDGELLPHLAWSEATLAHMAQVLDQLYPEGTELPEDAEWVPVVKATAPMYNDYSIAVLIRFPDGEAAAER